MTKDITVKFQAMPSHEQRVTTSLKRFEKRCISRNIPFKYALAIYDPKEKRAFTKDTRKIPDFLDSEGGAWRLAEGSNRTVKSQHLAEIFSSKYSAKKPSPDIFKSAMQKGYKTLSVSATYTPPSNWKVVAQVEPADPNNPQDTPAIYTAMFNQKIPERVGRKKLPHKYIDQCDHCSSGRKRRKKVFIVESPKGQKRYVGSSCLKTYTGLDPSDLENLLMMANSDPESSGSYGGRYSETTFDTSFMDMLIGAYATQKEPYKSGLGRTLLHSQAIYHRSNETLELGHWHEPLNGKREWRKAAVIQNIFDFGKEHAKDIENTLASNPLYHVKNHYRLKIPPNIMLLASDFAQAVDDMKNDRPSDFTRKVLSVAESGVVQRKTWNVYAGASSRWLKKIHENWFGQKSGVKPDEKTKSYTGEIGERIAVKVFYHSQRETKNGYTITEFRSQKNEAFVTFGTADISQIKTGDKLLLTGTIKRHGAFNGNGSTTLNRITMVGGWKV